MRLLGWADGGVVPAGISVVVVAAAADALASPANEEEAAGAQTADDDYEAQYGHGDDNAQIYA